MQQASSVACPECGLVVAAEQLRAHLRAAHHLYQYRGTRAPLPDTVGLLVAALCRPDPDPKAYAVLERIARSEYMRGAPRFLASSLSGALARLDPPSLPAVCVAVARFVARRSTARAVTAYLAADATPAARQLALALTVRLPAPLERRLVRAARPLLRDRALAEEGQLAAAAALLRTTGKEGPRALSVLKALVAGLPRHEGFARLRRLAPRVADSPALADYLSHLGRHVRLGCPRCRQRLRRPEMVAHLWSEHGLVLDGETAREPWQMLQDWLAAAVARDSAALLARCREFAQRLDPVGGPRRLQRLALAHGVKDHEARRSLLAEAAEHGASLCPHCYDLVPVPREVPPRLMSVAVGRLSAFGIRVEVSETGLVPRGEIETPDGQRRRFRLPGRRFTRRGATFVLAGPAVLLALALAVFNVGRAPLPLVAAALGFAAGLHAVAHFLGRPEAPADHRAVDLAWGSLVPRLHAEGFSLEDSAFVASLALASRERGRPEARRPALDWLTPLTERVVRAGFGGARHLAALRLLAIADAARQGKDRVLLFVAEVDSCFHGTRPLAFADGLLEGVNEEDWTPAERARLRVLLLESAFEAGFETRDVVEAAEATPALAAVLAVEDTEGLAQLRLLWSLRASRPWDGEGQAATAFALAADRDAGEVLGRYPDLLLRNVLPARFAASGDRTGAHILVCGRGVVFRDAVLTRAPQTLEVVARKGSGRGSYDLVVDGHRFRFTSPPDVVATRLERWSRYYFQEFLPRAGDVFRWQSPDAAAVLRAWGVVHCPDCRRPLLPRLGDVGVSLEEAKS